MSCVQHAPLSGRGALLRRALAGSCSAPGVGSGLPFNNLVAWGRGDVDAPGYIGRCAVLGMAPLSLARRAAGRAHASPSQVTTEARVPPRLSGQDIRRKFLQFFESRGHLRLPSSSLVPEDPTVLLTIAGMLQFKPVFLGQRPRPAPRVTTTQKCVRTNDIENVGVTARHHTFFEMLGNFSFGDYFKEEAIAMAWELSTKEFLISPERIWVSVYEKDDESLAIWRDKIGVPAERIKRMGEKDNFWASGPTGPCGPCSELYYDFHPERGAEGASLEDDSRFIEFYNLVFMEFNRDAEGRVAPLEKKNIDTGMGLERMAQILQRVPNNYETDLVRPLMDEAARLAGTDYDAADDRQRLALKVIADHTRAVTYLVSDGVTPSNVGRGYVVRRLLRRVVMKGRLLGIPHPFLPAVSRVSISLSGDCDPDVARNADRVLAELEREEMAFVATLKKGEKILSDVLDKAVTANSPVSGPDAFLLYDTFGVPLECTVEWAAERGVGVDVAGFDAEMERQKRQSQAAREDVDLTADAVLGEVRAEAGPTQFCGYEDLQLSGARVVALLREGARVERVGAGEEAQLVLDRTPFYAESGGQVGDRGRLRVEGGGAEVEVVDVQKAAGGELFVHSVRVAEGSVQVGDRLAGAVDEVSRGRIRANHTATHLLQSALKAVLGPDTCQQGSLVTAERLRFDFNSPKAMTQEQLREVEDLVNTWVGQAHALEVEEMPIAEAKAKGAIAMFGERYADVVRVVDVPGVSMELCGGTHVGNTSEIRGFKILSEAGIASGIRRIEAVTGDGMIAHLNTVDGIVRALAGGLKVKPEELEGRVRAMQDELRAAAKEVADLKSQLALAKAQALLGQAEAAGSFRLLVARLDGVDAKGLQDAALGLQQKLGEAGAVVLGSASEDGKVSLAAAFGKEAVAKGANAGKFIGGVARACGGGGGGKPNVAQAGAKDASKLDEALSQGKAELTGTIIGKTASLASVGSSP